MSRTRLSIGALLPHSALRIPPLLLRHHDQTHLRPEFVLYHGGPRRRHPRPAIDPDLQEVRPRREDDPGARDQHRLPFRKVPHHFHLPGILGTDAEHPPHYLHAGSDGRVGGRDGAIALEGLAVRIRGVRSHGPDPDSDSHVPAGDGATRGIGGVSPGAQRHPEYVGECVRQHRLAINAVPASRAPDARAKAADHGQASLRHPDRALQIRVARVADGAVRGRHRECPPEIRRPGAPACRTRPPAAPPERGASRGSTDPRAIPGREVMKVNSAERMSERWKGEVPAHARVHARFQPEGSECRGERGPHERSVQVAVATFESESRGARRHRGPAAVEGDRGRDGQGSRGFEEVVPDIRGAQVYRCRDGRDLSAQCPRREDQECDGCNAPHGLLPGVVSAARPEELSAPITDPTGAAPRSMSRSTRWRNARYSSSPWDASATTTLEAVSTGTPRATRSDSTPRGTTRLAFRAVRSRVRSSGRAPSRSATAPAFSSSAVAAPSATRAVPSAAARARTAPVMA